MLASNKKAKNTKTTTNDHKSRIAFTESRNNSSGTQKMAKTKLVEPPKVHAFVPSARGRSAVRQMTKGSVAKQMAQVNALTKGPRLNTQMLDGGRKSLSYNK